MTDFGPILCAWDMWSCTVCNLQIFHWQREKSNSMISHDLFFGLCAICARTPISLIVTWNRTMRGTISFQFISEWRNIFSPSPFHTTAYSSQQESRFTQWAPLSSIYFCLLDLKGINQWWSHTGQRTMHTLLACDADLWAFDAVLAGLEFYLLHHMIYSPLLTSNNACMWVYPWKRHTNRGDALHLYATQQYLTKPTKSICLPQTSAREFEDSVVWPLSGPVCLMQHE